VAFFKETSQLFPFSWI